MKYICKIILFPFYTFPTRQSYQFLFMLRLLFVLLLYFFIPFHGVAQQWLGISSSNYAGTNAVYLNPANVADSRYRIFINLGSNDIFVHNNYVQWNAPFSMLGYLTNSVGKQYRSADNKILFKDEYLIADTDNTVKKLHAIDDFRGPSIQFDLNDKQSIALLTRMRTGINLTNIDAGFANFIRLGIKNDEVLNKVETVNNAAFNINSYAEFGFTFGQVLLDGDEDFIKMGITAKRLIGLYSAHALIDEMKYEIVDDPTPTLVNEKILRIDNLTADIGYTKDASFKNIAPSPGWVLGDLAAGNGWGFDIGFVYEFRPDTRRISYRDEGVVKLDPTKNKYQYRLSIALLDIGSLKYANPDFVKSWISRTNNKLIGSADFRDTENIDDSFRRINNTLTIRDAQALNSFRSSLPSSLNVNLDYLYKKNIYINATWTQSLTSEYSIGMKMPSLIAVTPRWETKWFEVALPLALVRNYSVFTFGLSGRVGPVFIGSDNLAGLLNIGKSRGLDLYFGATIPIFQKPPYSLNACFYEKGEHKSLKERLMFWK